MQLTGNLRFNGLYVLVGATWGLVLGLVAGLAIVALGAGVSWLYLFGDETWPEAVSWVLPLLGALGGLAVFAGSLITAARFAPAPSLSPAETAARKRKAHGLLGLGVILLMGLAAIVLARSLELEAGRRTAERQGTWYEQLRAEQHKIESLGISPAPDGRSLVLRLDTAGQRGGAYRLDWRIRLTAYRADLLEGGGEIQLDAGDGRASVRIDAQDLIRNYHRVALEAESADVLVEESLQLEAALRPVLTEDERARLPGHEQGNLDLGQSSLIERRRERFTARFQIREGDQGSEYRLLD
jgi:hypothetical protein